MAEATDRIAQLEAEEAGLVLTGFDRRDAWELGSRLARIAVEQGLPVVVDIRTSTGILFHASLPGATADNDSWVEKKSRTALRFELSTALLTAQAERDDIPFLSPGWLDPAVYTLAGGAVPIRVAGVGVVAVATVSGLASDVDHQLVVDAVRELAGA
ncbi:heme-binding protein [Leifsonia poae]|uniref:UPF0303 protein n=1 Tax=Leifsonia poae TaxID=110933 RepID=A0A9W6M005_9MICO|nr:heme-binding protein [Leifsonia poae]GLJ76247.1 UPF0303 protein [Leifsonia poae]